METQPFLVLGNRDRVTLIRWAQGALDRWAATWFSGDGIAPRVSWGDAGEPDRWLAGEPSEPDYVAVGYNEDLVEAAPLLFAWEQRPVPGVTEVVRTVVEGALADLVSCLRGSDGSAPRYVSDPSFGKPANVISLRCSLAEDVSSLSIRCGVRKAADLVRPSPTRAGPALTPLGTALQRRTVTLRACLAGSHLSLGELTALKQGDVIVLDHRLDTPVTLVADGGASFGAGSLCAHRGHRAIQIAAGRGK